MDRFWRDKAKCAGRLGFVEALERVPKKYRARTVEEACRDCPVMRECARDCFALGEDGVVRLRDMGVPRAGVWVPVNPRTGLKSYQLLARRAGVDA